MIRLSDAAYDRLRDKHPAIADVVDSGRDIDAMRKTNIVDLKTVMLFRERRVAARASYGVQIRGNGGAPSHA